MRETIRKPLLLTLAFLCLVMAVVGSLLPFLQGWIFLLIALYLFARESETARKGIRWAREKWPWLSEKMEKASHHRWAPRHVHELVERTAPRKS
ncbi:MAG: hypothetical protein K0S54_3213 [Alphaproteobacteria bacterium]|jgi:uncharacterized membrane protein YbaN (DUF454 family)|nr:hypothetical protein [Alphaproteobacteria bacterium]